METIANICKGTENLGNNQTDLKGAPDKPCGVGRADVNPKLLLNDT